VSESASTQIYCLVGEKVALGPFGRELEPLLVHWANDLPVMRPLGKPFRPSTFEQQQEWSRRLVDSPDEATFAIYERSSGRPIGDTSLFHIDHRCRRAEFFLRIGERDCWHQGYGGETVDLMLEYGFRVLGLNTILLDVASFNTWAIRAYRRAGFREIGRWREAERQHGRIYDIVLMECLASEFPVGTARDSSRPGVAAP
jgi:diamine N-acetyltransferase